MNLELKDYLTKYGFKNNDFNLLLQNLPALNQANTNTAVSNIILLEEENLTKPQIAFVIASNPAILLKDTAELSFEIIELKKHTEDVSDVLFKDPFLI